MRSFLLSLIVVASLPLVAACGEDAGPQFLRLNYQVECTGCSGVPPRQIETLHEQAGNRIDCTLTRIEDRYLFNLSFSHPSGAADDDYAFKIQNASVSVSGGPAAAGTIEIVEHGNRYTGSASGSALAPGCAEDPPVDCPTPCRLYEVAFTNEPNGPTVTGSLECDGLPQATDRLRTAEVKAPLDQSMPANFLFENCTGLEI